MKQYQTILSESLSLFGGKIFSVFELACFRNEGSIQEYNFSHVSQTATQIILCTV